MYWDTFLLFFSILLFVLVLVPPPKKKIQERLDAWPSLAHLVLIIFKNVAVMQLYYHYNVLQRDLLISLLHCGHIDYEVTAYTKWQTAADEMPTL